MTGQAPAAPGARSAPPVFPYSVTGAPRACLCRWDWRHDIRQFVVTHPEEHCPWHTLAGHS